MPHSSALRLAFLMDPIGSIDVTKDTTFVLMLEAQRRGHRLLYLEPRDLWVDDGRAMGRVRPVTVRREAANPAQLGEPQSVALDDAADVVFQRKDPPVDWEYTVTTQMLALCRRAVVLNRPEAILAHNEKILAVHFADLMPETRITRRIPELVDFMAKLGGEMIVKPLDGKGGEGIFHLSNRDRNLFSILEQSTRFETRWIMAQRYLPEVRQGDKRILLLEGRPLGAVLRVPAEQEVRANLHVGGRPAPTQLDAADRRIVERLAPLLVREGLFFVGIDVIGGRLTEVNVTSPTGLQEIDALEGVRLEERVIDAVEAQVRGSGPQGSAGLRRRPRAATRSSRP
jgi:glutathione synthase